VSLLENPSHSPVRSLQPRAPGIEPAGGQWEPCVMISSVTRSIRRERLVVTPSVRKIFLIRRNKAARGTKR
jgi:hypothetical protein